MKKIFFITLTSLAVICISCGGQQESHSDDGNSNEMAEEHIESHEGHDHEHANTDDMAALHEVPEGSRVFFENLEDGMTVTSPFHVVMAVEGMQVHPAGEFIQGTGHHHILIDDLPSPTGVVVPADETHIHFGGGQMDTELDLEKGKHTLTLQFADGLHRSYGEQLSATIAIEVE